LERIKGLQEDYSTYNQMYAFMV